MISVCQYLYMPFTYIQLGMKLPFPTKKASKSIHVGMKLCFTISQSNSTNMFLSNQILLNTVTVAQRQSCTNTACCPRKAWEGTTPATGKADPSMRTKSLATVLCYESKPACILSCYILLWSKINNDQSPLTQQLHLTCAGEGTFSEVLKAQSIKWTDSV